jgi:A/G-specific adenine glycosylase
MYFCSMNFQEIVSDWYLVNKRDLPWRHTNDAYIIWLSEIIMQQTRVEQGLPYFNKFLTAFPTVSDFAGATETEVLNLWQGLGYYSRGRNMLYTAREVLRLHNGVFPTDYLSLITLKGIGSYTAAAISSFAANEQQAVVDGNVYRVLARYFGIDLPINSSAGKKEFSKLAQELIEGQQPAIYNQAIMEFGALQCKPKSPDCSSCPLQLNCFAFKKNLVNALPAKLKAADKKVRHLNYFLCTEEDRVLVKRRTASDIWQHLYDFPLLESPVEADFGNPEFQKILAAQFGNAVSLRPLAKIKHLLTHQIICVQFFGLDNYISNFNKHADCEWVTWEQFEELPQPKVISNFLTAYLTKY